MSPVLRAVPIVLLGLTATVARAETPAPRTFNQAVRQVMRRPEFRHASFGVEIYSLDTNAPVFSLNGDKLFTPGSTTKLLTEGTALRLLGPDYRFKTPIYRAGDLGADGELHGDLVLVASGDPNLSNREQPDGTLAFADEDHTYGGPDSRLVPGDPLAALRDLAQQVAKAGVKHVTGRVLVDLGLFPEEGKELGTGVHLSPIAVNDNVIDLTVTPGGAVGAPLRVSISPQVPYIRFQNQTRTTAGSAIVFGGARTVDNADGSETVILGGSMGMSSGPAIYGYPVTSPSRFAGSALTLALRDAGVVVDGAPGTTSGAAISTYYQARYRLAEHTSAPLSEEIKVTLKVSHNLHASMTPFLLGALVGKATQGIDAKGFALEKEMLVKAGLDLSGASQADGAGGSDVAYYSPDFMARYLAFMSTQSDFPVFERALPVLGRDGTLASIQKGAPGAGHVFAKTGTYGGTDLLTGKTMIVGKGLAGYTTTPQGRHYAFALYVNHVELGDDRDPSDVTGQALGEIASAAYALPIDRRSTSGEKARPGAH